MEAYSASLRTLPVSVGGLVGRILPPGAGRVAGGCTGVIRLDEPDHRYVGGLAGRVSSSLPRRFVGGCAGFGGLGASHLAAGSRLPADFHREAPDRWGEETLEGAMA